MSPLGAVPTLLPDRTPLTSHEFSWLTNLESALQEALVKDRTVHLDALLAQPVARAMVNRPMPFRGEPALFDAVKSSSGSLAAEVVQRLLDAGAEVNAISPKKGCTPLLVGFGTMTSDLSNKFSLGWRVGRTLIQGGANVHERDVHGWTVLHHLLRVLQVRHIDLDLVQDLLEAGADLDAPRAAIREPDGTPRLPHRITVNAQQTPLRDAQNLCQAFPNHAGTQRLQHLVQGWLVARETERLQSVAQVLLRPQNDDQVKARARL